jgi:hypothetical protein
MPDLFYLFGGHPDVDEFGQMAVGGDHAQRNVPGSDEIAGSLHDPPQQHRQGQVANDHLVRPQQSPQAPLGGQHLLGAFDELSE